MASGTLDLLGGLSRPSSDPPPPFSSRAPTSSQLTIFYAGTVNVYNDVPADKARAIMLLLANGDEKNSRSMDASVVGAAPPPSSLVPRAPVGSPAGFIQPLSRVSTPPMSPFPASQPERKPQLMAKRTQAELPFARKASLARFLEKRKDRVQVKQEVSEEAELGNASKRPRASQDESSPL